LVLAAPYDISPGCEHLVDLTMEEVQGSMSQQGIEMGNGAKVVLSAVTLDAIKSKQRASSGLHAVSELQAPLPLS